MSWIYENTLNWFQRWCFYILKCGNVPKHVAIIMDGNRRFARRNCVQKSDGHKKGFDKLAETLQWCLDMDVYEVTVYAFSIENYKRSKDEVDTLMDLAKEKFKILIDEWRKLREHGVCVRFIGNLTLVPKDVLSMMLMAMLLTKDNRRGYLNIAFSYTSKEEMSNTSQQIIQGVDQKNISQTDITEKLTDLCLYSHCSTDPDLVIRTSGEVRLSDFLIWQNSHTYFHCVSELWPEFSAWNLMASVFCYQHFKTGLEKSSSENQTVNAITKRGSAFSNILQKERLRVLMKLCLDVGVLSDITEITNYSADEVYNYYKKYIATSVDNI